MKTIDRLRPDVVKASNPPVKESRARQRCEISYKPLHEVIDDFGSAVDKKHSQLRDDMRLEQRKRRDAFMLFNNRNNPYPVRSIGLFAEFDNLPKIDVFCNGCGAKIVPSDYLVKGQSVGCSTVTLCGKCKTTPWIDSPMNPVNQKA